MPIPGVIAEIKFSKTTFFAIHGGTSFMKHYWVMSDHDGVIALRPYFFLHIFSKFDAMTFYVQHPWYGSSQKAFERASDFATLYSGDNVIFMDSLRDRYKTASCYSEGKRDLNGNLKETCKNGGKQFGYELVELSAYFQRIESEKIKKFDSQIIPSKESTKDLWRTIGASIYKDSPYKPWRAQDPGEVLIK